MGENSGMILSNCPNLSLFIDIFRHLLTEKLNFEAEAQGWTQNACIF